MLKENFLFLLPVKGIETLVTMVTSTKLFEGRPVESSDDKIIHYHNQLRLVLNTLHCDWLIKLVMWLAESVFMIQSVSFSSVTSISSKHSIHWPGLRWSKHLNTLSPYRTWLNCSSSQSNQGIDTHNCFIYYNNLWIWSCWIWPIKLCFLHPSIGRTPLHIQKLIPDAWTQFLNSMNRAFFQLCVLLEIQTWHQQRVSAVSVTDC